MRPGVLQEPVHRRAKRPKLSFWREADRLVDVIDSSGHMWTFFHLNGYRFLIRLAQVLQKVKISGGGRCNVMHDKRKPLDEILKVRAPPKKRHRPPPTWTKVAICPSVHPQAYPRGNRELLGPYKSTFGPSDAYRSVTD